MDVVIAAGLLIGTIAVGVVASLIANELYDRSSRLAQRIIERAAASLPEQEQSRYREEWLSHLEDMPGKLGKLLHASGCLLGARKLATELVKTRAENTRRLNVRTILAAIRTHVLTRPWIHIVCMLVLSIPFANPALTLEYVGTSRTALLLQIGAILLMLVYAIVTLFFVSGELLRRLRRWRTNAGHG